jgi:nicotinate-nucleotide--dimethylbenzimidazole phosphoribosyltransferase
MLRFENMIFDAALVARIRKLIAIPMEATQQATIERWNQKTKPLGSLGALETVVVQIAGIQNSPEIRTQRQGLFIFCGDHGVVAQGVSLYPQAVTAQMVANYAAGGAAISVICRHHQIATEVVDCGVIGGPYASAKNCWIGPGTKDFSQEPAMTLVECQIALNNGLALAVEASERFDMVGVGEMGIGNTTAASAILHALTDVDAADSVGRGTGVDEEGMIRKAEVIAKSVARYRKADHSSGAIPSVLTQLGGFEIATMVGFLLGCVEKRIPVVIDGFICTAAVLVANATAPGVAERLIFSHASAEKGHRAMLSHLSAAPLLQLDMRLGEGSGAGVALGVIQTAAKLYAEMATFAGAGVSEANS